MASFRECLANLAQEVRGPRRVALVATLDDARERRDGEDELEELSLRRRGRGESRGAGWAALSFVARDGSARDGGGSGEGRGPRTRNTTVAGLYLYPRAPDAPPFASASPLEL